MFDSLFPKHWTTLQRLMWLKTNALARAVYEIVTGNPVSFSARSAPLRQLQVAFSPVQSGSGDPSPDNVRPISGWSSMTVEQRGRNLLPNDISAYSENDAYYYIPAIMPHDTLAVMSLSDRDTSVDISGCYIGFIGDYNGIGSPTKYKWVINNGTVSADKTNVEQTSPRTGKCEGIFIYPENTETFNKLFSRFNIQVELGSTAHDFVPYNPLSRSISISLGQTVYSGWVDVISGVGEIDKVLIALTGTERYQYRNAEAGIVQAFWKLVDNIHPTIVTTAPVISNMFASSTSWDVASGTMSVKNSGADSYFNFRNTAVFPANNIDGVKAKVAELYAAGTPVSAIATLATPIPISLTPQEVQSLAGDNTMWSNANQPITVEYRKN